MQQQSHETNIQRSIENASGDLSDISNYLWSNPETAYKEVKAHDKITDYLEKKGFQVQRRTPTDTAFLATFTAPSIAFSERKKPVHVALMCEYDALPGIGHACGHNLIAIVGLGAAVAIKEVLESEVIAGKVTVIGCPAEEFGGGKVDHIIHGNLESVDLALMAHPAHENKPSPRYLACLDMKAEFTGKPSHASKKPWEGRNALDAVVLAYQNISCLRQQLQPGWQVHGVITKGGDAPNIIPHSTQLSFMIRALKRRDLEELKARVSSCIQGAAMASGCEVKLIEEGYAYDDIIQNKILESLYVEYMSKYNEESLSRDCFIFNNNVALGSTDMGNVSYCVPSLHPAFKIGDSICHTESFAVCASTKVAIDCSLIQAKVLANIALLVMKDMNLLEEIKKNFMKTKCEFSK